MAPSTEASHRNRGYRNQGYRGSVDCFGLYLAQIRRAKFHSAEEERQLFSLARGGDMVAREQLLLSMAPLVVSLAIHYNRQIADTQDLIQAGNLGVIRAFQKFDESRGFRFITYARFWILQSIRKFIADRAPIIRVPMHWHERVDGEVKAELQRLRSIASIDEEAEAHKSSKRGVRLYDSLADLGKSPIEQACNRELVLDMRRRIGGIRERWANVLMMRAQGMKRETIARKLGVSKQRIQQIEKKAMRDLARSFGIFEADELEKQQIRNERAKKVLHSENLELGLKLLAEGRTGREINRLVGYSPTAHWFTDNIKRKMRLLLSQGITPDEIGNRLGMNTKTAEWQRIRDYLKKLGASAPKSSNRRCGMVSQESA